MNEVQRDWHFIAEQSAPAPHLAHPEGCAALRIVLVAWPRVSRSSEHLNELHVTSGIPTPSRVHMIIFDASHLP